LATGWLKNAVLDSATPTMSIITRLKMHVGGYQPARSRDVVHASDVTKPNFCPRQWALLDLLAKKKKDEYIATALQTTFDIGNATAKLVTDEWLGDAAVGNWKCRSCGDQRTFCSKPANGCKKQGMCNWEYAEVVFESQQYGVSGSIDVMVDLGVLMVAVTELKIIRVEDFEKITTPLPEHSQRTQLYLKLIADSASVYKDRINLHEARVVYVSRGYGKKNLDHDGEILPFREFIVKRDDKRIQPLLDMAKQVKVFRESLPSGAINMPSGICKLPTDKYAKNCGECAACFSGNYPATQPALEL
jgi:hypothetical protein